jgi:hypothetical protein
MVKRKAKKKSKKYKGKKWIAKATKGLKAKPGILHKFTCTPKKKTLPRKMLHKIRRTPVGKSVYMPKCKRSKRLSLRMKRRAVLVLNINKRKR